MRNLFFASALSILLVPHFSYAVEKSDNVNAHHNTATVEHHARSHSRSHTKANNTTPVDINHADATELTTLKGVGPKRAEAILAYRQSHGTFQAVDDLSKVKGIGKKGLLRLQHNNPGRITLSNTSHT